MKKKNQKQFTLRETTSNTRNGIKSNQKRDSEEIHCIQGGFTGKKRLKRKCLICGKYFYTIIRENGKYSNGHYFGKVPTQIEGTGEWKKVGTFRIGKLKGDTVKWTGKEKKFEYWECNSCYEDALHMDWLERKIEESVGEKCPDYEPNCAVCQAWRFYETLIGCENEKNAAE